MPEPYASSKLAARVASGKAGPPGEKANRQLFEAPQRIAIQKSATMVHIPSQQDAILKKSYATVKNPNFDTASVSSTSETDNSVPLSVDKIRNVSKDTHWTER